MRGTTALAMFERRIGMQRLSFGCSAIDELFSGNKGLHSGITEISGEAGCGKTQLCLQLALQCAMPIERGGLEGSTAFMSCGEGEFPLKRLAQLSKSSLFASIADEGVEWSPQQQESRLLSQIHIEQCRNVDEALISLLEVIPKMCRDNNVKLLIIDSMAGLVRNEYDTTTTKSMSQRTILLFSIANQLKRLSDLYRMCIVVVNQVTAAGIDGSASLYTSNATSPALGLAWSHCINSRIVLSRHSDFARTLIRSTEAAAADDDETTTISGSERKMTLMFSPMCASPRYIKYMITSDGVFGIPS